MKKILLVLLLALMLPQILFSAPIHDAAEKGDSELVKKLIANGVSPNIKDEVGNTPLHWAAMSGNNELITLLINSGTNINATNELGVSALILAVYTKNYKSAKLLSSKGANPNIRDSDKATAVSMAVASEKWDLVRHFILNGADPNLPDENGAPPLAYVAEDIGNTMIKWLVEHGANVNVTGHLGMTPLHRVASWGNADLVKLLIDHGANLDAREIAGVTPLYYAILYKHLEIVEMLLDAGANPDVTWRKFSNESYPKSALDFARSHHDREYGNKIEALLIEAETKPYIEPDPCISLQQVLNINRLGKNNVLAELEGKRARIFVETVSFWEHGSPVQEISHEKYDAVAVIDIRKYNLAPMILFKDGCSLNVDAGFITLGNVPALLKTAELISNGASQSKIKKTLSKAVLEQRIETDFEKKFKIFQRRLNALDEK